jgi:squalene cyclase
MSRRKTVSNLMRVAIDDKSAHDFAWALLELARKEYNEEGKFSTLSATDIKNLIQALMDSQKADGSGKVASIHEIKSYMKDR